MVSLVLSRRALLLAGVVVVAGCRSRGRRAPAVDPDAAAWQAARDSEAAVVAGYEALATSSDAVAPIYAAAIARHRAHLAALGGGPVPTAAAGKPDVAATVAPLTQSAITVRSGTKAAVLASIAASHLAEDARA